MIEKDDAVGRASLREKHFDLPEKTKNSLQDLKKSGQGLTPLKEFKWFTKSAGRKRVKGNQFVVTFFE